MKLAIVSQSARIYTEMAQREGFDVLAVDAFNDADTVAAAREVWRLPALLGRLESKDLHSLAEKLDAWQPDAVLLGSGFEGQVEHYEWLYKRYPLLGNQPTLVSQLKHPQWLKSYCDAHGVLMPAIQFQPPDQGRWLLKQAGQCGGIHVRDWDEGVQQVPQTGYWQTYQVGQAVGALFVAEQQKAKLIGVHALKQRPGSYAYAGASRLHDPVLDEAMQSMLDTLISGLRLVGINSLDAIWHDGYLHLLEINPRLSASMRLYANQPLIRAHIASCQGQTFPELSVESSHASHCIWYAGQKIKARQLHFPVWLEDRPYNGAIEAGEPLCSIYAEAGSSVEVQQILQDRKTQLENLWGPYVSEHIEFNIH